MDIVEKLRNQADADDKTGTLYAHVIGREAADEIERLRMSLSEALEVGSHLMSASAYERARLLLAVID